METVILKNLVKNEPYARKTTPFLQPEYFHDPLERLLFNYTSHFILKYNNLPTKDAILISFGEAKHLSDKDKIKCLAMIDEMFTETPENTDTVWLIEQTEKFCKNKAIFNALKDSIAIHEGDDKTRETSAIPDILSKALAVTFDTRVGHDFLEDTDARYEYYHRVEERIPFDLEKLNKITRGGVMKKTLNVVMAAPGVGKSAFLCHTAASYLTQNLNVLYITLEMSEEEVAKRIDANLLDIAIPDLERLPFASYGHKIDNLKKTCHGRLMIKEYPTAAANVGHFRNLLDELKIKKKFTPDAIFVDYLNICSSSRFKVGNAVNSYTFIKAVAEELRGLAGAVSVPLWTATQVNREGAKSSDMELTDTSESFGLPATADFMIGLIETEEMAINGEILVKQLKNRTSSKEDLRFLLGVDKTKMKFCDHDNPTSGIAGTSQSSEIVYASGNSPSTFDGAFSSQKSIVGWKMAERA